MVKLAGYEQVVPLADRGVEAAEYWQRAVEKPRAGSLEDESDGDACWYMLRPDRVMTHACC